MAVSNLKSLIGKLNETCRRSLESAAGLCMSQTHYEVDIEHFLIKLLDLSDTDLFKILHHFEINEAHLVADLTRAIESFKTGNARTPALSPRIPRMIKEAWLLASVEYQAPAIRSGHVLLALLDSEEFSRMLLSSSETLKKISIETLKDNLQDLTAGSAEDEGPAGLPEGGAAAGRRPAGPAGTKALDQYTINLTERAKKGEIDPVLGRDFEIRQMVDILIRRRQNNPILTGEAGVGKTAVVEGFALRIAEGDVPPILQNVALHTLDLGLLQAGAGVKGEFENRLKGVINEVKASPVPIILFIDEAHTLIGAGGQAGSGDAANLLKPALARGELRTIAATTWAEYKKYFEKDAAMARRFQVVKIEEPDEEKAMVMMRAIGPFLEKHHNVMITDEALADTVKLSHRYISGRQLPDKAVSVLDTACARVAIGLTTSPPAVEQAQRRIGDIDREIKILNREMAIGRDHSVRLAELTGERETTQTEMAKLTEKWQSEMDVAGQVRELYQEIHALMEGGDEAQAEIAARQEQLKELETELEKRQGDDPLVQIAVDSETVSAVVSGWTGIPTGRMLTDEIATVLNLADRLKERIIGQDHGLDAIEQVVQTAHAGIEDPSKPTGVFMLVGPSGVGKTETALALSELLYGGEQNMISINMSEYQEAHTVSSLKGSPPGYVGYGEGGVLTEAVRRKPYSVVLLDEVEKAHPDVMELFFQVFDKGIMEDGEGRRIDFKNCLIILTSNLGTDLIMNLCADEETMPDPSGLGEMVKPELLKHFKPAFLGRMKIVPYFPITDENMKLIVRLKLSRIVKRMQENREVEFLYDDAVVDAIAGRCTDVDSGARNADHIMTNTLLPEMSRELLSRQASGEQIKQVKVSMDGDGFAYEIL
ncbi:ClpV1 family T6SS ATPase [Desulfosarcina ovata subsp. sediminis]|uniref:ClpV1 family T6SS ATPase n=1 Tax=Desulfosarcina ovata subsp. sediminis TaxID=885957 RepID=A0A5K7ZQ63_9BACT|nr:type VI secretion system ATPase TssH [Desulfosarcina ovata]BBO81510.1 ClpV1 family T6SS ATPase [Desulfosarcina ovata subsp. sediminis]